MYAELYILLMATAGTVSIPSTAGDEQAKDTASSEAEARGHKEAQAPSVLAPVESSQKGSRAPKKSTTTPNRWDATRNGARKGFLWGGSMTSLVKRNSFFLFFRNDFIFLFKPTNNSIYSV